MKIFIGIISLGSYKITKSILEKCIKKSLYKGLFIKDCYGNVYKSNPFDFYIYKKKFTLTSFDDLYKNHNISDLSFNKIPRSYYVSYININNEEVYILNLYILRLISKKENILINYIKYKLMFLFFVFWMIMINY